MNNIDKQYKKIKNEGRMGLMTHVVIGYPTLEDTRVLTKMMDKEGVDYIELQIPFSDPLGDGLVIHEANTDAITNGIHVSDAFKLIKTLREEDGIKTPLLFMTYINIIFTYGFEKFCFDAERVGINGLIVPDYNLEHEVNDHFSEIAKKYNLILIRFVSLDSDEVRMKTLAKGAEGFIYCFSTQGITGVRKILNAYLSKHLTNVRKFFKQPLAVGFGISNGEQIKSLKKSADIVIVGSALIEAFKDKGLEGVRIKTKELVKACQ